MLMSLTFENSARDVMSFKNQSSGAVQSLISLLQIVATFTSLFIISLLSMIRQVNSMSFLLSIVAVLFLFISTGTRSLLLMVFFAMAMGAIYNAGQRKKSKWRLTFRFTRLPFVALNVGVVALAVLGIVARFRNNASEMEEILLSSVSSHNDMFRELVFILTSNHNYPAEIGTFLLTPISFALPSFLGFNKSISSHLIFFNFERANIDLILGEGNVFPGLLGDAYMLTGAFAPFFFTALILAIFTVFHQAALKGKIDPVRIALLISLLAYFFISVRNLQGSLLIVICLAIAFRLVFKRV